MNLSRGEGTGKEEAYFFAGGKGEGLAVAPENPLKTLDFAVSVRRAKLHITLPPLL